ncbi:hypothetical protein [Saccharopolyspora spinosa]|uniref:hypothetical protein n=1 Tax=Saccharopolyspora spinosa TaxID=60894 RepID=UPI00376ED419
MTEELAAELAELRSKVARRKQQKTEDYERYRQGLKAAVDRVAELEELAAQGPLTEEQEAELAALQLKVAQRKQKRKEDNAEVSPGVKGCCRSGCGVGGVGGAGAVD